MRRYQTVSSFLSKNKKSFTEGEQVSNMENVSKYKMANYRSTSSSSFFP